MEPKLKEIISYSQGVNRKKEIELDVYGAKQSKCASIYNRFI